MLTLPPPAYRFRLARDGDDLARIDALRRRAFRPGQAGGSDLDPHDRRCRHAMVEARTGDALAATFRFTVFRSGGGLARAYAAGRYDLGPMSAYPLPMIEIGRLCAQGGGSAPDILRLVFAGLAAIALDAGAGMVFGCTSLPGTDPSRYRRGFAALARDHLGPAGLRPHAGRGPVHRFAAGGDTPSPADLAQLPPLMRSYLRLGGWVSDHAVIDADLGTIHVFTALELAAIPPARSRSLRRLAEAAVDGAGSGG